MSHQPEPATHTHALAVIGAGATTMYFLKHLLDNVEKATASSGRLTVTIFERGERPGMGMPYNPRTTDRYNICNISSEELPRLQVSFVDWLRDLDDERLEPFGLARDEVDPAETYPRVLLGEYFESQFVEILRQLREAGIDATLEHGQHVLDVKDEDDHVDVETQHGSRRFDTIVIATGHPATEGDDPANGYYASPWPICKLLPRNGQFYNHAVGTLGASLSAFDVVASLSHRHGSFVEKGDELVFEPDPNVPDFRIVLHSSEGWLPHLQYEQAKPMRSLYRHVSREALLDLRDSRGWLRLDEYYDVVCRPLLADALAHDGKSDVAAAMRDGLSLDDFVETMEAKHTYDDAFDGMRSELPAARRSIEQDRPIRWMEVLDDLMYTLNFHAELMPAEDHVRLRKVVMSFLMNVIAALPLQSARTLLALRQAGRLDLVEGHVSVDKQADGETHLRIEQGDETTSSSYKLFINCSGEDAVNIDDYPFRSLVDAGVVRAPRVQFADAAQASDVFDDMPERRAEVDGQVAFELDGIEVDAGYRVIGRDGKANSRVIDIAFPHALGLRPYSYGLQACDHTAGTALAAWLDRNAGGPVGEPLDVQADVAAEREAMA